MAKKVLILLGTKKGAFILESDTERRSWDLRGPHLPDLADEPRHRRSGDRDHLRWRRQRMVRPGRLAVDGSRRELDAFEPRARVRARRTTHQDGLEPRVG